MRYPIVNKGVTMSELPGEVAVFFEVGNCTVGCPGCHSPHLSKEIFPKPLWTHFSEIAEYALNEKKRGATAIVVMGGTSNGLKDGALWLLLGLLSRILPVGLYCGDIELGSPKAQVMMGTWSQLTWLKLGAYMEDRGGMNKSNSNQRLLKRNPNDTWSEMTHKFWK